MNNVRKLFETSTLDSFAKECKAAGKKVLGTYCCHLPEEILYAADIMPYRVKGTGCSDDSEAEAYMSSFSCSFARAILENFINGTYSFLDGLVGADGCLMVQRVYDNWKVINNNTCAFHQFNTPRVSTPRAHEFYRMEIKELKEMVEKFSGITVTEDKLVHAINVYNETRRLIRELYELRKADAPIVSGSECLRITLAAMSMPKDLFNELLSEFLKEAKSRKPITDYKARLMLIGSAVDDPEYLKIFEDKGGMFVTDVQCFGSRYLWEPVKLVDNDPLTSIANSYLERVVCPRMCDMHYELSDLIIRMAKDFRVDGIVFVKMKNCDPWGGESMFIDERVKEAGIPILVLEREEIVTNIGQVGIRAEAFLELIEAGGK
jgi:benzoyl-CoA reductase subunit C